jgi:hypothetical protein
MKKYHKNDDTCSIMNFHDFVINNPEFHKLNIGFTENDIKTYNFHDVEPAALFYDRVFDLHSFEIWDQIDPRNSMVSFLKEFEKYMTQLSSTVPGVSYTKGDLYGTADIGVHGIQMIMKVGFKSCRMYYGYDKRGYRKYYSVWIPAVGIEYISKSFNFEETLNVFYKNKGDCNVHGLHSDFLGVIPEHRWYKTCPGNTCLENGVLFKEPEETFYAVKTFYRLHERITHDRTLAQFMEVERAVSEYGGELD